jgi:Pvc16 N-terminal domain
MAGFRALSAVGLSIVALLQRRFDEELGAGRLAAVLATTDDFEPANRKGANATIVPPSVSVYCYRLSVDRETRPSLSARASVDGIPRLPLRMHLLVSPWDVAAVRELEWIGLAARVLESQSIISGPLLHPAGGWAPGDSIQVVQDEVALEAMSEAFQAFDYQYRLCLPYLARVVRIDGDPEPRSERVTTVLAGAVPS